MTAIQASDVMTLRKATGAGLMDCKRALQASEGNLDAARDFLRKQGVAVAAKKSGRATTEGRIALTIASEGTRGAMAQLACETDFVARTEVFRKLTKKMAAAALEVEKLTLTLPLTPKESAGEALTAAISELGENIQLEGSARLLVDPLLEDGERGLVGGYVHTNGKVGVLVALAVRPGADAQNGAPQRRSTEDENALATLLRDLSMHIAAMPVEAVRAAEIDPQLLAREREIITAQAQESGKPPQVIAKMVSGRMAKLVRELALEDQPFVRDTDLNIAQLLEREGKQTKTQLRVLAFRKLSF